MLHLPVEVGTVQEKVYCGFKYGATKPGVIENKICEGTDCLKAVLSSGMTSFSVRLPQQEVWAGGGMNH